MAWFDAFERESWPGRSIRSGVLGCKILGVPCMITPHVLLLIMKTVYTQNLPY
jgi:hypothetical protein